MPHIYYDFPDADGNSSVRILKDITTNVRFIKESLENIVVYDHYDIRDDETPEIITAKIYGSSKYHWIIMLLNDIYDYREDLPKNYSVLSQYVTEKYGAGNEYAIHHWISPVDSTTNLAGDITEHIVMPNYPGAVSVSNFQYEDTVNESKRRIKIPSKEVIDMILKQYTAMFS